MRVFNFCKARTWLERCKLLSSARCQAATSSVRLIILGANKHPNDGNGELHKAKGRTFLTMEQAGEARIAGLWWGHTIVMLCWPESSACPQVAGFISRTYIEQKQSFRKIIMRVGLRMAFYLSPNTQWVHAKLPGCMLWCLSTENWSPQCSIPWFQRELCQTQMGCATVPPANGRTCPEETGAKLRRCWEQKEASGRSLAIQWHKIVRSMLCRAVPFLLLYPAWHLRTQPDAFPQGKSWSARLLGFLPADPWPWGARGPWWEQGSTPPTSWSSSNRASIQPDTEHGCCLWEC